MKPPHEAGQSLASAPRPAPCAARDVLMLVNRTAGARGGGSLPDRVAAAISQRGFRVARVEGLEALAQQAERLLASGDLRAVVAVGGDGTLGAALNATPPGTPLVVAPAGTENLLSKYLGSIATPEEIARLVEQGVPVALDAGLAGGRLFSLMLSVGFDAEVVRRVHAKRRGNITHLAYAGPIFEALRHYRFPKFRARWVGPGGAVGVARGGWLFGVNLPRYAQGIPLAPGADGADGLLDLCVFRWGNAAAGLYYLFHVLRRRHHRLRSVTTARCLRVRIDPLPGKQVPYQLDGDPGGFLPVEASVAPGRMTLLVEPDVARRLGFDPSGRPLPRNRP